MVVYAHIDVGGLPVTLAGNVAEGCFEDQCARRPQLSSPVRVIGERVAIRLDLSPEQKLRIWIKYELL